MEDTGMEESLDAGSIPASSKNPGQHPMGAARGFFNKGNRTARPSRESDERKTRWVLRAAARLFILFSVSVASGCSKANMPSAGRDLPAGCPRQKWQCIFYPQAFHIQEAPYNPAAE